MQHHVFDNGAAAQTRMDHVARYRDGAKRWMDIAGVLALAPVAVPLVAMMWVLVRLGGGPGFYGQQRIGRGGRRFTCWKIRTMVPDAQVKLQGYLLLNPSAAQEWSQSYKLQADPRVTRLGSFMRRSSLDELPQLWNVLKGEMSLVGPRPVPAAELHEYQGFEWAYLTMRPGITGVWQVSGRNGVSYNDRVRMDAGYLMKASLRTDMEVLWRTVGAVLRRTGR